MSESQEEGENWKRLEKHWRFLVSLNWIEEGSSRIREDYW